MRIFFIFGVLFFLTTNTLYAQSPSYQYLLQLEGHSSPLTALSLRKEDNLLVSGDASGGLFVWNFQTNQKIKEQVLGNQKISHIAVNSTGQMIAVASYDGKVYVCQLSPFEVKEEYVAPSISPYGTIKGNELTFVQFMNKDSCLVFGGYNGMVTSVNRYTTQEKKVFTNSSYGITCGVLNDNDKVLWFAAGPNVYMMNVSNHKVTKKITLPNQMPNYVCELNFIPNKPTKLGLWLYNGSMQVWDISTLVADDTIKATRTQGSSNFTFSNDATLLLTANDSTKVNIWDYLKQTKLQVLEKHNKPITCVAFTPDKSFIVTGSVDNSIIIWGTKKEPPKPVFSFKDRENVFKDSLNIASREIEITIKDYDIEDGDTLSLFLNNVCILDKFCLSKMPHTFKVKVTKMQNTLLMFADNVGRIPPNTASITVFDGSTTQKTTLKATKSQNSVILLNYSQ